MSIDIGFIVKFIKKIPGIAIKYLKRYVFAYKGRTILFFIALGLIGFLIAGKIRKAIFDIQTKNSPIIELTATNENTYFPSTTIKTEDFNIIAIHENGGKTSVPADYCYLSQNHVNYIGETTSVTLTYDPQYGKTESEGVSSVDSSEEDEETSNNEEINETAENTKIKVYTEEGVSDYEYASTISCQIDVKSKREELLRYETGYPDKGAVLAIVYSNGELAFVGEGDIMTYDRGEAPWLDLDEDEYESTTAELPEEFAITGVSFEESVTPSSLNYICYNLETLKFVDKIPSSVKTMRQAFSGCEQLESMADMSECKKLIDISMAYENCEMLTKTYAIPNTVREADSTFEECINLVQTPDMTNAQSLVNCEKMYYECASLVRVTMPPNGENFKSTFAKCINLKLMPNIPVTATNTNSMFAGDVSLTKLTTVPKNVTDMGSMFSGCELISGTLKVNANPDKFSSLFNDAALASNVNLKGESKMLTELALTSSSLRVLVNGKEPNPDLSEYDPDVRHEILGINDEYSLTEKIFGN